LNPPIVADVDLLKSTVASQVPIGQCIPLFVVVLQPKDDEKR